MNLPGIVKKSFDELRNQQEYIEIVNFIVNSMKKLTKPSERAKFIHSIVDKHNEDIFSHPLVQQLSPCKMGCTACCHTQVSVTEDEARLLVERIYAGVSIDMNLLKLQMKAGNDSQKYYGIDYKDRKCVFLADNGACKVYEDRPSVCRTNAVLGPSEQCDTSVTVQPTRLVRTPKSDMAIYGSYLFAKSSGVMPNMIGQMLGLSATEVETEDL